MSNSDLCCKAKFEGCSVIRSEEFVDRKGQKLNYSVGPRRIGDVSTVYADPSKAKRILGWETKFTLGDALTHAWQWQKQLSK